MEDYILEQLAELNASIDDLEGVEEEDKEAMKAFSKELAETFFSITGEVQ
jgi:hypothetical protein